MANGKSKDNKKKKKKNSKTDASRPTNGGKGGPLGRRKRTATPERKRSAYSFFASAYRAMQLKKNPNTGVFSAECVQNCKECWRNASRKAKLRFEKMAAEDKERYEREKARHDAENQELEESLRDSGADKNTDEEDEGLESLMDEDEEDEEVLTDDANTRQRHTK